MFAARRGQRYRCHRSRRVVNWTLSIPSEPGGGSEEWSDSITWGSWRGATKVWNWEGGYRSCDYGLVSCECHVNGLGEEFCGVMGL